MLRKSKAESYLDVAVSIANRSSCSRRKFGAVIVKNDTIIATGYNGTMRGALNFGDPTEMPCLKDLYNEEATISYNTCPALHAEENACLIAGRERALGSTMYLAPAFGTGDRPCFRCRRVIWQTGIKTVIFINRDGNISEDNASMYVKLDNEWMMDMLEKARPDWVREELEDG